MVCFLIIIRTLSAFLVNWFVSISVAISYLECYFK
jgi:hypothetical protein